LYSTIKFRAILIIALCVITISPAMAQDDTTPLFPLSTVVSDSRADAVYPSVSGDFLVYSQRKHGNFSVIQTSVDTPGNEERSIVPKQLNEAIRFGVATHDGSIGYVSNRMGPVSAWLRQAQGDGHVAIANMGTFRGAIVPMNLHASADGRIWCFDSTLEKVLRSRAITQFGDAAKHMELLGQTWRFYSSDAFGHKLGYRATKTGNVSKFRQPSLFIFNRDTNQLTMIPNAMDGAISPDGKRIAFVRNTNGNYDIWTQNLNGKNLIQLTSTPFGEFEPAWSQSGKYIAFASNRDSKGDVLAMSIYALSLSNGTTRRLTQATRATDGGPTWKDAHTILFHSNRSPSKPQTRTVSNWNIWQVNIQGAF
jgi:hypothetical protein